MLTPSIPTRTLTAKAVRQRNATADEVALCSFDTHLSLSHLLLTILLLDVVGTLLKLSTVDLLLLSTIEKPESILAHITRMEIRESS
jgi:hypothetical protein